MVEKRATVARVQGRALAAHDHVCLGFDSDVQRDRTLVGFLADGMVSGHDCLGVVPADEHERLAAAVQQRCAGLESGPTPQGRLGFVAIQHVREFLDAVTSVAGGAFARVVADMSWAASIVDKTAAGELLRSEADLTGRRQGHSQVTLCMYDTRVVARSLLLRLSSVHTHLLAGGHLVPNAFHDQIARRFRHADR